MKRDRLKHRKQASCCGHARDLKGEGKSVLAEAGILAQGLPASSTLLGVRNKAVPFVCVCVGGDDWHKGSQMSGHPGGAGVNSENTAIFTVNST